MKSYTTQPGTIPHRVIEWLKLQPAAADYSSGDLAEALDVDVSCIVPCLATPKKHGALRGRKEDGCWRWSLGDGTHEPLPFDIELDEPLNPELPAVKAGHLFPGVTKLKARHVRAAPKPATAPTVAEPVESIPTPFRVGYFSDGSLQLDLPQGGTMVLDPAHAFVLRKFIADFGKVAPCNSL